MSGFATVSALQALQDEKSRIDALLAKLIEERTALMQENARLREIGERVERALWEAHKYAAIPAIIDTLREELRQVLEEVRA